MKKIILILAALALSLSANTFTTTQKVKVSHSKPIYKTITKRVPYQECYEVQVPKRNSYRSSHDNPLGTLIGGVAGGIIGNQVGKGRGKTIATVSGALIGSMVGHNLSRDEYYTKDYRPHHYVTQQKCTTRYHEEVEQRIVGYKNIAYFNGEKIVKITPHKKRFIHISTTYHY